MHRPRLAHPALALVLSALGCATATGGPDFASDDVAGGTQNGAAGSPSAGSGAGGSPSGGSGAGHAGAPVTSGGAPGTAGSSSVGGSSGASSAAGSGNTGNTGPVTVGLPFTEDFETGMIAPKSWTAVADQVPDSTFAKWTVVADDTGKAAQLSSDGTERFLVGGNSAWTDQKLELRLQIVSGSPEIDIAFRYQALKNYYYLELADKHFKVRDRSGINDDLIPTVTKPPIATGTWYKVTLQIKGNTITGSLNDALIVSGDFASTPIAAGGIAIGVGSGSGVVLYDDIHVTAP